MEAALRPETADSGSNSIETNGPPSYWNLEGVGVGGWMTRPDEELLKQSLWGSNS